MPLLLYFINLLLWKDDNILMLIFSYNNSAAVGNVGI